MTMLPLRTLPPSEVTPLVDAWLEKLGSELGDPAADRGAICRRALCEISYPEYAANWETAVHDEKLPLLTRAALLSLHPRNITLEPEYYADCDQAKFQQVKPLLWLWHSFDHSPIECGCFFA